MPGVSFESLQTFTSSCTLLDGGSLASHYSQHNMEYLLSVHHGKGSYQGYFGQQGAKGATFIAFNLFFCLDICIAQTRVFFSSLSGSVGGNSRIYKKGLPGITKNACSTPKLPDFLKFILVWAGLTYHWYLPSSYFSIFGTSSSS